MSGEIARLVLAADSREIRKGTDDLRKMERQAGRTEKDTKRLSKSFGRMGKVAGVAAGALAALFTRAVIKNTIEQDHAVAQLNASLESTGRFTIQASRAMQDHAAALQQVSTFGDEAIISMQSQLLTFTKLGGDVLPRTTQAVLDLSAKMDQGLKESAVQLGKALNDPVANLGALGRVGIQFSKDQKELIKTLAETGRMAEAQGIILDELETQFGGAAVAARNTLGGALKVLSNNFGDLLEVSGDGTSGLTGSINQLADTLARPEVKEGFQTLATGAIEALRILAQFPGTIGFIRDEFNALFGVIDNDDFVRLDDKLASAKERAEKLEASIAKLNGGMGTSGLQKTLADVNEEIRTTQNLLDEIDAKAADRANKPKTVNGTAGAVAANVPVLQAETAAQAGLNTVKKEEVELITVKARLAEPAGKLQSELIEQMQFENTLIGLTNEKREEAIALRRLGADATEFEIGTIKKLVAERQALESSLVDAGEQAGITDGTGFDTGGFFSGFVESASRGKEAMSDFVKSAIADLARLLIQKALLGSFGGGGGSSATNFFGSLFGGGRATGGSVFPGKLHPVTELGRPELLDVGNTRYLLAPQGGNVVPIKQGGQGGNSTTNITVNLPPQTQRITAQQTANEISRIQKRENSRNR